jgi:hypothetical protein
MCPVEEEDVLLWETKHVPAFGRISYILRWLTSRHHKEFKENHCVASEIGNCTRHIRTFIHLNVTFHAKIQFFRANASLFVYFSYLWFGITWQQVWETEGAHTGFWWGDLRTRDHLQDLGVDGRIILKRIFKKWDGAAWTGFIWLRNGTGGGLL